MTLPRPVPVRSAIPHAELWAELRAGGPGAAMIRERLILGQLPLVRYMAGRMASTLPPFVEMEDLASYGTFGLIDAIDRFDPERGIRFETFAAPRIRGAMLDEIRHLDWAPKSVRYAAREVARARERLTGELDRQPTAAEVAEHLGVGVVDVRKADANAHAAQTTSLALPTGGGSEIQVVDHAAGDLQTGLDLDSARAALALACSRLPSPHREVVALRYGSRLGLRQVGARLGFGQGKATRVYVEACLMLRELMAVG